MHYNIELEGLKKRKPQCDTWGVKELILSKSWEKPGVIMHILRYATPGYSPMFSCSLALPLRGISQPLRLDPTGVYTKSTMIPASCSAKLNFMFTFVNIKEGPLLLSPSSAWRQPVPEFSGLFRPSCGRLQLLLLPLPRQHWCRHEYSWCSRWLCRCREGWLLPAR